MTHSYMQTREFQAIERFYGDRKAARSQVPLINHIHEGVAIITALGSGTPAGHLFDRDAAIAGYCLHPLFQNDAELASEGMAYLRSGLPIPCPMAVALTMEYRHRANAWLSNKVWLARFPDSGPPLIGLDGAPDAGPIPEVTAMLIADKVQNYKDFLIYHGNHANAEKLDHYFKTWLKHLQISPQAFLRLKRVAEEAPIPGIR